MITTKLSYTTMNFLVGTFGGGFKGWGGFFGDPEGLDCAVGIGSRFEILASTIFGFLTTVAGLAFLLYFALGAITWITSGGEPQKLEAARNQMIAAGIGLVAVIAAYTVAGIVAIVLGIDILNPTLMLQNLVAGGVGC